MRSITASISMTRVSLPAPVALLVPGLLLGFLALAFFESGFFSSSCADDFLAGFLLYCCCYIIFEGGVASCFF